MTTRIFSIVALLALSLTTINDATAKGPSGNNGSKSIQQIKSSSKSFHSYGLHHRNWSSWCWSSDYGCYFYWCPTENCCFYWYAPARCFYSVAYLRQYAPTACTYSTPAPGVAPVPVQVNVPIQITNTNQNTVANGNAAPVTPGLVP